MIKTLKKPLVWTNVAAFIFAAWLIAGLAFGFNDPPSAPPGGSGAISVDASGNVGISTVSAGNKLNVTGNISINGNAINTAGTLNSAGNPLEWTKLKNVPAGFADGVDNVGGGIDGGGTANYIPKFIDGDTLGDSIIIESNSPIWSGFSPPIAPASDGIQVVGDVVATTLAPSQLCLAGTCRTTWPTSGGVTGSGSANRLTKWTSSTNVTFSSSIQESGSTAIFLGDILANSNSWGTQSSWISVNRAYNSSGYWGTINGTSSGLNWTMQCPPGYYMIGIRQTTSSGLAVPGILCARL